MEAITIFWTDEQNEWINKTKKVDSKKYKANPQYWLKYVLDDPQWF